MTDKEQPDPTNFRIQRIEKLLYELRYELERGFIQKEIDETISFEFIFPISSAIPDGVIHCKFQTRPMLRYTVHDIVPKLRLVKND